MVLRVSGKNLDIGEALRQQIVSRIEGIMSRFVDGDYKGSVTVSKDGNGFRSDCIFYLPAGVNLEATGVANDAYASFDQTVGTLEKRLRRYQERLKTKMSNATARGKAAFTGAYTFFEAPSDEIEEEQEYHPVVIAETTQELEILAVSEAVLQLDMTGAPVLVFQHAGTGRVNVVYRRGDGAIGWVDSPPNNS
ncbi:ribosome-associated translation inhibitor RaiA [Microvirga sp. W0021]|uniref:Ribosome hibernation promoting factor n=1 Tax=Hohaiivirga grylli TaxID=3133970 RepID=A0ABV0BF99_9HYPH